MLGYHTPNPLDQAGTPRDQAPSRAGTPPRAEHAGRYGQRAGRTHPTGMHSCCNVVIQKGNIVTLHKFKKLIQLYELSAQHHYIDGDKTYSGH